MMKQSVSLHSLLSMIVFYSYFSPPFFSVVKVQASLSFESLELYLAARLWISVLTVSENELFRFCLSQLSLHLPPLPLSSLQFLSAAFSSLLSFSTLSFSLSLSLLF